MPEVRDDAGGDLRGDPLTNLSVQGRCAPRQVRPPAPPPSFSWRPLIEREGRTLARAAQMDVAWKIMLDLMNEGWDPRLSLYNFPSVSIWRVNRA